MFRIGLIGTENSHAMAFAKYFNLPKEDGSYNQPGFRVTGVYGPDPDSTKAIMEQVGVDFIARDTDEFIGKVDGVIITCRAGSRHFDHAAKFAALGMPLFVDKPFTVNVEQARELVALTGKCGVAVVGGSSVKYSHTVDAYKSKIAALRAEGKLTSLMIHYAADTDSIYDGFWFYASHSVEYMLALLGKEVRRVTAVRNGRSITAVMSYDDINVTLQYSPDCYGVGMLLVGPEFSEHVPVDMSEIHETEASHYADMVRTGKSNQTPEELTYPVILIDAILRSAKEGRTLEVSL